MTKQDGQTLSALEARLPMTRFGVMKHLKVLGDVAWPRIIRGGRFHFGACARTI